MTKQKILLPSYKNAFSTAYVTKCQMGNKWEIVKDELRRLWKEAVKDKRLCAMMESDGDISNDTTFKLSFRKIS
jgi:hypothetical protein